MIKIEKTPTAIYVRVDITDDLPLGLKIHSGDRDTAIRLLMKKSGGAPFAERSCRFTLSQRAEAEQLQRTLTRRLSRIAAKPLSQRQVQALLGITAKERARWTSDGRLPRSGLAAIKPSTTTVSLWTYAPEDIARLLRNPHTIAAWRAADAT